jgi:hypothetical protein
MTDRLTELQAAESAAQTNLEPIVGDFRPAFSAVDELLRSYAVRFEGEDPSPAVATAQCHLLTRFADDIRTIWLLAERGYGLQAMALAASALEIGFTAGHIRFSEEKARTWLEWEDPYKTPWSARQLIDGALSGNEHDFTKGFRLWYANFCWGKHANPIVQTNVPPSMSPAGHVVNSDPALSRSQASRTYWALYGVLSLVALSIKPLIELENKVPASAWSALERLANEMRRFAPPHEADGTSGVA